MATEVNNGGIWLTREGDRIRLAFPYHPDLVTKVKMLPYAVFDKDTRTWTVALCAQSVDELRRWGHAGLTAPMVDDLLADGETPAPVAAAILRASSSRTRPWMVHVGIRDDTTFARLRAIPGASWDKRSHALAYPPPAAPALYDAMRRGLLSDPDSLLTPAAATVAFDTRTGAFSVLGDERAQKVLASSFPRVDVVGVWRQRGLDAQFLDDFSEQMYRGELARATPPAQPDGLNVTLYEYQRRNVGIALARDGHAIFDEPGLGKTVSAIAVGVGLLAAGRVARMVVVVPAAVRTQWANEIRRFTSEDSIVIVSGDKKARARAYEAGLAARWVIVHYDVLSRDADALAAVFAGAGIVADEAHRVKSPDAARTKALKKLSKSSGHRLALTGTPVETSPSEWFEILSGWAVPGSLGSSYEFNERYRWRNPWGGYEGARNVAELKSRSLPLYSRHTKKAVAAHLPPLQVHQVMLDPEPAYAAALRRAHADAAEEIRAAALTRAQTRAGGTLMDPAEAAEVETGAQMTATGLLRLLCSSPRIVDDSDSAAAAAMRAAGLIPDSDGPKLDYLRTMAAELCAVRTRRLSEVGEDYLPSAEDVTGERMVVFTSSKRMANLIAARLAEDGVTHVLFTGDTSSDDRDRAVADFTDPASDVSVFISTDAGAEGLNLGRCANLLVNVDLAWTAARMAQRAQRIHRVDGTAAHYEVINLTLTGTIEAGIVRLLDARADLTDALFGESGGRRATTGRRTRSTKSLMEEAFDDFRIVGRIPEVTEITTDTGDDIPLGEPPPPPEDGLAEPDLAGDAPEGTGPQMRLI